MGFGLLATTAGADVVPETAQELGDGLGHGVRCPNEFDPTESGGVKQLSEQFRVSI